MRKKNWLKIGNFIISRNIHPQGTGASVAAYSKVTNFCLIFDFLVAETLEIAKVANSLFDF